MQNKNFKYNEKVDINENTKYKNSQTSQVKNSDSNDNYFNNSKNKQKNDKYDNMTDGNKLISNKTLLNRLKVSKKSGMLNLSNMSLNDFPSEIFNDKIYYDDLNWWEIVDLTKLDGSNNFFSELDKCNREYNFTLISGLTLIKLSNNKFNSIPASIFQLSNLKSLDFSSNNISEIPESINSLINLVELILSKNKIVKLDIKSLSNLEVIDLSTNQLNNLDANLLQCSKLKKVNFSENNLKELKVFFFANCNEIYVSKNKITNVTFLPDKKDVNEFFLFNKIFKSKYENLIHIDMHNNLIEKINIPIIKNLDSLILGYNRLTSMENLRNALNLTVLDINNNKIENFPPDILLLNKLKTLNIQNNSINDIPSLLALNSNLVRLNIEGNPLRKLNSKLRSSYAEQIKIYLKTRITNEELEWFDKLKNNCLDGFLSDCNADKNSKDFQTVKKSMMDIDSEINYIKGKSISDSQVKPTIVNNKLSLEKLNLSEIPVESILNTRGVDKIVSLDFKNNNLKNVDDLINLKEILQNNKNLKEIDFSNNKIEKITNYESDFYGMLVNSQLNSINLSFNKIINLFQDVDVKKLIKKKDSKKGELKTFSNLKIKDVNQYNRYKGMIVDDEEVEQDLNLIDSLEYLNVSNNRLSEISVNILSFNNLKTLILSNNQINDISFDYRVANFPNLITLDLGTNKIQIFPSKFYLMCPLLLNFNLENNDIRIIPSDIAVLCLNKLSLHGNPIKHIRSNILNGGNQMLLDYINKLHEYTDEEKNFVENKSGKNKIVNKFINNNENTYDDNSKQGLNKYNNNEKILNNTKVNINQSNIEESVQNINSKNPSNLNNEIERNIIEIENEIKSDPLMNAAKKFELKQKLKELIKQRAKLK